MGKPQRWLPIFCSNHTKGVPGSGYMRNMKFVSNIRFAVSAGIANTANARSILGTSLNFGFISPPASSIIGYIASRICTVKECMCIRLLMGRTDHVGVIRGNTEAGKAIV